jgi:hypothetical protein
MPEPPVISSCPLLFGSGKFGTPLLRMHCAYLSTAWVLELLDDPPLLAPFGKRLRQSFIAVWNCEDWVSMPDMSISVLPDELVLIAESGKFCTPFLRMQEAKAIAAVLAESLLELPEFPALELAELPADELPPELALVELVELPLLAAFGEPPQAASPRARATTATRTESPPSSRLLLIHCRIPTFSISHSSRRSVRPIQVYQRGR